MKITAATDFKDVRYMIESIGPQAEYAAAVALTKTAKEIREELKLEMGRVFDRPTNYTLNSLFVKPATKRNLEAFVWLKDATTKGTPADKYLKPQIFGGDRTLKSMEKALQQAGKMKRGSFAVPAAGAQLDAFGNVKRTQIVQILSQLQVQRGGGYDARRSNSAASKRSVRRQGVTYFSLAKQWGKLKPGIYLKKIFAHGSAVRPVFLFVDSIKYQPRFDFFGVADRVARERLPAIFNEELKNAIETAIPKRQTSFF